MLNMQPADDHIAYEYRSVEIAASPEAVYAMVSDITRMGEWSPEAVGGEWIDSGTGNVGDRFTGKNRTSEREWTRECEVAEANSGRGFTFVVGGVEANCTWWSYELEPLVTGTKLTERWWIVNKTPALASATPEQFAGRVELTKSMLSETLQGIKAAAESSAA
jgi:hypothetical protein